MYWTIYPILFVNKFYFYCKTRCDGKIWKLLLLSDKLSYRFDMSFSWSDGERGLALDHFCAFLFLWSCFWKRFTRFDQRLFFAGILNIFCKSRLLIDRRYTLGSNAERKSLFFWTLSEARKFVQVHFNSLHRSNSSFRSERFWIIKNTLKKIFEKDSPNEIPEIEKLFHGSSSNIPHFAAHMHG